MSELPPTLTQTSQPSPSEPTTSGGAPVPTVTLATTTPGPSAAVPAERLSPALESVHPLASAATAGALHGSGTHPYLPHISSAFYSYRLADFNRRYHIVFLERAKRKSFRVQVLIAVLTAVPFVLLAFTASLSDEVIVAWVHRINPVAAVLTGIAFLAAVIAPLLGMDKSIEELTIRIQAWQSAKNQIESSLRFLIHDARTDRDADLQVGFANAALSIANSLPQVGEEEPELSLRIKEEVQQAYPRDYPWRAL